MGGPVSDEPRVEFNPTIGEALEALAAVGQYAELQKAHGQVPSVVLGQFHNDLRAACARFREQNPEEFGRASQAIYLRTRMPA